MKQTDRDRHRKISLMQGFDIVATHNKLYSLIRTTRLVKMFRATAPGLSNLRVARFTVPHSEMLTSP